MEEKFLNKKEEDEKKDIDSIFCKLKILFNYIFLLMIRFLKHWTYSYKLEALRQIK